MYKALVYFTDLQDENYAYQPGDTFPRDGLEVSEKRLTELASMMNKRRTPVIEWVKEEPTLDDMKNAFKLTKSEVNGMRTADLQDLGAKLGIADAESKTGGMLKKEIVAMLNL